MIHVRIGLLFSFMVLASCVRFDSAAMSVPEPPASQDWPPGYVPNLFTKPPQGKTVYTRQDDEWEYEITGVSLARGPVDTPDAVIKLTLNLDQKEIAPDGLDFYNYARLADALRAMDFWALPATPGGDPENSTHRISVTRAGHEYEVAYDPCTAPWQLVVLQAMILETYWKSMEIRVEAEDLWVWRDSCKEEDDPKSLSLVAGSDIPQFIALCYGLPFLGGRGNQHFTTVAFSDRQVRQLIVPRDLREEPKYRTGIVAPTYLRRLREAIQWVGFDDLSAHYMAPASDQATKVIQVVQGEQTKTVDDYGDRAPWQFAAVRALMVALNYQTDWSTDSSVNLKDPATYREALNHMDPEVRGWACRGLGECDVTPGAIVQEVTRLLSDDAPEVRRSAADVLGKLGPQAEQAVPALVAAIENGDKSDSSLAYVAGALGQIGVRNDAVVEALSSLSNSPVPFVAKNAELALQELGTN